jgi:hypothetical protein
MHLADILTPAQIIPAMRAANRWEAIDELVGQLVIAGRIAPPHLQDIAAVVKKRAIDEHGDRLGVGIPCGFRPVSRWSASWASRRAWS